MLAESIDLVAETILKTQQYEAGQSCDVAIESAKFAHQLLDEVLSYVRPGVLESEIKAKADAIFADHKIERTWHQTYVRFDKHALLTYRDKTPEDLMLTENSIAFVDLGIVKNGVEGDAGRTVVFGNNPEFIHLKMASEAIFAEAKAFWQRTHATGQRLYQYIQDLAYKMDVEFVLDPAGHLIGEFPHRGWKKGLNNYPTEVLPGRWILEIQIADSDYQYGAFFEDLLY